MWTDLSWCSCRHKDCYILSRWWWETLCKRSFFHAKAQISYSIIGLSYFNSMSSALKHNYFTALLLLDVYAELMYNYWTCAWFAYLVIIFSLNVMMISVTYMFFFYLKYCFLEKMCVILQLITLNTEAHYPRQISPHEQHYIHPSSAALFLFIFSGFWPKGL